MNLTKPIADYVTWASYPWCLSFIIDKVGEESLYRGTVIIKWDNIDICHALSFMLSREDSVNVAVVKSLLTCLSSSGLVFSDPLATLLQE